MELNRNSNRRNRLADLAALLVILTFLTSSWLTLYRFGISWDEGLGNFFFGNRYAQYISSGFDPIYLDFGKDLGDANGELSLEGYTPFRDNYFEFPGLIDTLSGLSMRFFSYQLKLVDPVDAFHAVTVLIAALYLWGQYYYTSKLFDRQIALFSILLLATAPRFWGDSHFNPKDIPEAAFFGLSILSFLAWIQKPGLKQGTLVGVFIGFAMAVKANAVFIPVILLLWLLFRSVIYRKSKVDKLTVQKTILQGAWMFLVSGFTYYLSWPLLYTSPSLAKLYFQYIFSQGGRQGKGEWSLQPTKMILAGNAEIFVILLCVGLAFIMIMFFKRKSFSAHWLMVLLWFLVPILRISAPISVNFDGFRHYLEYLPAASLIAALGAVSIIDNFKNRSAHSSIIVISFILFTILANTVYIYAKVFPYNYIYFNQFVGGSTGALKIFKQGEVTDYWAVSYRDGIRWLNQSAGNGALLDVPIGDYLVTIPSGLWLREDIKIISDNQIDEYRDTDREVYIMNINRPSFFKEVAKSCAGQPAVYEKIVDGVTVMTIHLLNDCQNP